MQCFLRRLLKGICPTCAMLRRPFILSLSLLRNRSLTRLCELGRHTPCAFPLMRRILFAGLLIGPCRTLEPFGAFIRWILEQAKNCPQRWRTRNPEFVLLKWRTMPKAIRCDSQTCFQQTSSTVAHKKTRSEPAAQQQQKQEQTSSATAACIAEVEL